MAESEQQERTKEPPRLADQAERSLKEANRLAKEAGDDSPNGTITQLEQARVLALLELAQAVRSKA